MASDRVRPIRFRLAARPARSLVASALLVVVAGFGGYLTGPVTRGALVERAAGPAAPVTAQFTPVSTPDERRALDSGALVTWMVEPVCLLAGHDYLGWSWIDDIGVGEVVEVTSGPCAGRYQVFDHRHTPTQAGKMPVWMYSFGVDLVLQTCTGDTGTGFSLLRRV